MIYALAFLWWLSGAASFIWLRRQDEITWGTLAGAVTIWGVLGPVVWIVIVVVMLPQADFWAKPIFPLWRKR